jgi:hypothetical protein
MKSLIIGGLLVLAAAFFRILPHPANVTPIAAMALAGGVYLDRRFALVLPLVALVLSDLVIGFHATIPYVYGSFLAIGLVGLWLRSHKSFWWVAGGTLAGSVLFFIVTNFGVWVSAGEAAYPQTWAGLMACYVAALPFFRNTVLGDLASVGVLFTMFEVTERWLRAEPKPAAERKSAVGFVSR